MGHHPIVSCSHVGWFAFRCPRTGMGWGFTDDPVVTVTGSSAFSEVIVAGLAVGRGFLQRHGTTFGDVASALRCLVARAGTGSCHLECLMPAQIVQRQLSDRFAKSLRPDRFDDCYRIYRTRRSHRWFWPHMAVANLSGLSADLSREPLSELRKSGRYECL